MPAKVYEEPKGSDKLWFSITLEGEEIVAEIRGERQLAFEMAGRANAAAVDGMSANQIIGAMATAYDEYHKLPEHERRRRNFHLSPVDLRTEPPPQPCPNQWLTDSKQAVGFSLAKSYSLHNPRLRLPTQSTILPWLIPGALSLKHTRLNAPTSIQPNPAASTMPARLNSYNPTSARILRPPHDPPQSLRAGAGSCPCIRAPFLQNIVNGFTK